jgi:hypothetical protein
MRLFPAGDLASARPVMAVRWCLDPEETEHIKSLGAQNMCILFVMAYGGSELLEDRMLVPIDQMMAYLSFRRPGTHTVFARVLKGDAADKSLKKIVFSQFERGMFNYDLLNYGRDEIKSVNLSFISRQSAKLNDLSLLII